MIDIYFGLIVGGVFFTIIVLVIIFDRIDLRRRK